MDDRSGEEFGQRLANNVRSYCTVSPAVEGFGDVHRRLDPRGRILDLSKTHVGFAASTVLVSLIVSRLEFRCVLLSSRSALHSDPEVLLYKPPGFITEAPTDPFNNRAPISRGPYLTLSRKAHDTNSNST
jgi:hypothetical protein